MCQVLFFCNMNRNIFLVILILFLSIFVRFYNYSNRINFSGEQGLALGVSADYIKDKFTLLGQKTFLRTTSKGHILFSGSLYNYSLVPLLSIFNYNPYPITVLFTLLNIITILISFLIIKKIINFKTAFFYLILFSFNNTMINHSMYIWILNAIPLIGIISLFYLWKFSKIQKSIYVLILGLLSGIGINLEYVYLFTILLIGIIILLKTHKKVKHLAVYTIGLLIGNWTMVIFDIRHDFYYTKTLWQYFLDTIYHPQQSHLSYYHFLQYWPLMILFLSIILIKIFRINKTLGLIMILVYLVFNLTSNQVSFVRAVGMTKGLTYKIVLRAAENIARDEPKNFNIVDLPDSDFRAYRLRYLVKNMFNKKPESIENYSNIDTLYIFGQKDFNINKPQPWEIQTFKAKNIKILSELDNNYIVYKLTK